MMTNLPAINSLLATKQTLLGRNDPVTLPKQQTPVTELQTSDNGQRPSIREAFDDFVGQSFYGQLIGSMRKTVGKPAYLHGGRAEEVFQSQMDQQLAEHISDATAGSFTGPMFDLFSLRRT